MELDDVHEVESLTLALERYRVRYGEYPPDFTTGDPVQEINDHLAKIFPERRADRDIPVNVDELGPHNALGFWLNGFYDGNPWCPLTGRVYIGRHPKTDDEMWVDAQPIAAIVQEGENSWLMSVEGARREIDADIDSERELEQRLDILDQLRGDRIPIVDLDPSRRLSNGSYRPLCTKTPYVYFRSDRYATASYAGHVGAGVASPYLSDSQTQSGTYTAPTTFQVLAAGRDGVYGDQQISASQAASFHGQADNFTSFSPELLGRHELTQRLQLARWIRKVSLTVAIACTFVFAIIAQLGWRPEGLDSLRLITSRQIGMMGSSSQWLSIRKVERTKRRDRAIKRLRSVPSDTAS
ncbi:MAG: hypothetical protein KDA60_12905 [Planctomycetales bacterium]|nr:hypothetical protein [Planctomycetales bacterium]